MIEPRTMKIGHIETEIRGTWTFRNGQSEGDESCARIEALTSGHLREVTRDPSGWDILYIDPDDGRFWELIYPQSEMHGGGPPLLRCLSKDEVREKYGETA